MKNGCSHGQFQCELTSKCLPLGWICDGESDCGVSKVLGFDMSDEDPKQCRKNIMCRPNQARCGEFLGCIPIEKFCDGHRDCPDNSDEWDFCCKLFLIQTQMNILNLCNMKCDDNIPSRKNRYESL